MVCSGCEVDIMRICAWIGVLDGKGTDTEKQYPLFNQINLQLPTSVQRAWVTDHCEVGNIWYVDRCHRSGRSTNRVSSTNNMEAVRWDEWAEDDSYKWCFMEDECELRSFYPWDGIATLMYIEDLKLRWCRCRIQPTRFTALERDRYSIRWYAYKSSGC